MSHFNVKSLTFYGLAIASVAILFKIITAYGETNLKAPPSIGGRYEAIANKLPGCLNSKTLVLTLQQSGIYLNGSLLAIDKTVQSSLSESKPYLSGKWSDRQVNLSGSVELSKLCGESKQTNASERQTVNIQSTMEGEILKSQIIVSSIQEAIDFTATKETPTEPPEKH